MIDFINRLIIHIPDYHFLTTRYYGFYANASKKTLDKVHALLKILKNKDYSRETRTKALKNKLNKFRYRTHIKTQFRTHIKTQFNVNVKPQCSILIHIIHSRTRDMMHCPECDHKMIVKK